MAIEYQTFITKQDEIPEGQEVEMVIKDLTPGPRKYDASRVKGIIYKTDKENIPEGHRLYLRSEVGVLQPQVWTIKILERLPDLIPSPPYSGYKLRK